MTATATGDIVVHVGSGTYPLSSTWSFTPADSGRDATHVVRWEAGVGATPLFTGAKPVTSWTQVGSTGVWKADAPSGVADARQLYVDGQRATRARGSHLPTGLTETAGGYTTTAGASMGAYKNPGGIEFVYREAWTWSRCGVASISGTAVTMDQPCFTNRNYSWTYGVGTIQHIENAFELLDQPGEWYFDTSGDVAGNTTKAVYYKPRAGESMTGASAVTVTVPAVQTLLNVAGDGTNARVHHLQFVGLTFADSSWMSPSGGNGFIDTQANIAWVGTDNPRPTYDSVPKTPAAVEFSYVNDLVIQGNTITRLGSVGLDVEKSSNNVKIIGNHVHDTSGNGINIGGVRPEDQRPGAFAYTQHTATANGASFTATFGGIGFDYITNESTSTGTADVYIDDMVTPVASVNCAAVGDLYQQVCYSTRELTNTAHTIKIVKTGGATLALDVLRYYYRDGNNVVKFSNIDDVKPAVTYSGTWTAQTGIQNDADGMHDITLSNNYVHDVAVEFPSGVGIFAGYVDTLKLQHNEVADLPYTGISVGYGWGYMDEGGGGEFGQALTTPTIAKNNEITGNYVHHFMLAGHDGGAIYGLGAQPGSVQSSNHIANGPDYPTARGIYQDNGSGGLNATDKKYTISNNVVDRVQSWMLISDHYSPDYSFYNLITSNWANTTSKDCCTHSSNVYESSNDDSIVGQAWPTAAQAVIGGAGLQTAGIDAFGVAHDYKSGLHGAASTTNLAIGAIATASSEYSAGYSAAKAIDDNTNTRWSASSGTTGSLQLEFSSATSLDRVVWREAKHCCGGRIQDYTIDYWDGTTWKIVKSGSYPGVSQTDTFSEVSTTKIRLRVLSGSSSPTLSEFEVYNDQNNFAQGSPATQSSTYSTAAASRAVDGNTDGAYDHGSVSHTWNNTNAWWTVDLGDIRAIGDLEIWNRTDYGSDRLSDYWMFVSQNPMDTTLSPSTQATQPGVWSVHQTTQAGSPTTITAGVSGRYVMVQLAGTNYLQLAEVKVLPKVTPVVVVPNPPVNYAVAPAASATQVSTYGAGVAPRAIDGNTDGNYFNGSVSHTNSSLYAWWQVDLGSARSIANIELWNRTDGAADRLSDYWVFVSTTPFTTTLAPADQATAPGVVWSSHQTTQAGTPTVLPLSVTGRYVMVQLSGTNYLTLAEVKVFSP